MDARVLLFNEYEEVWGYVRAGMGECEGTRGRRPLASLGRSHPPVPIAKISGEVGVTPLKASLPNGLSGMIIGRPNEPARSYAEASEPETRRRFTLAHELGHYVERVAVSNDDDFSFIERRHPGKYNLHESTRTNSQGHCSCRNNSSCG